MAQMKREQKKAKHIKPGDIVVLEPIHHHRVDVVMSERIGLEQTKTGIGNSHREMRDVVNDKRKHDQPAHYHVTRSECCFHILPVDVGLWSRTAVFDCQLNRYVNVNEHSGEEEQPDEPKEWAEIAKVLRVTVDPIWTQKNLQIA